MGLGITGTDSIGTDVLLLNQLNDAMHRWILDQVAPFEKGGVRVSVTKLNISC
jgi:hypothetical protein